MTGRVAFLPTPSDPCLLKLWFKYYDLWSDEIDTLYVYANTPAPKKVVNYMRGLCEARENVVFIYVDHAVEHGEALSELLKMTTEPLIMFIEDDAFIFKKGLVNKYFTHVEEGDCDAVGSKRGSCSPWLYNRASDLYVVDNSGYGDNGPAFWPNFFFVKREDLLKTNLKFGAKFWKAGDYVACVADYAPEDVAGDTFVWASLQLRSQDLKFLYVPQYHGNTDDKDDYLKQRNIWDGQCGWLHAGSLSSGFGGLLDMSKELPDSFKTEQEKLELERRIVFWQMAYDEAVKDGGIPDVKMDYYKGLCRLYSHYGIGVNSVKKRANMYKEVMDQWM